MMRSMQSRLFVLALGALAAVSPRAASAQLGIDVGAKAPDAAVQTLDGQAAQLAGAFNGKPAVIEFWATWCPNCKALEPHMDAMQAKYAGKVAFVGVAVSANQSAERVRRYTAEHMRGFTHFYDARGHAVGDYDVPATSYVVIVDRTGKVVYTGVGGDQQLDAALAKAIK